MFYEALLGLMIVLKLPQLYVVPGVLLSHTEQPSPSKVPWLSHPSSLRKHTTPYAIKHIY